MLRRQSHSQSATAPRGLVMFCLETSNPMSINPELATLAGLRAKTDQQLIRLVDSGLERALRLVSTSSAKDYDGAEQLRAKAEKACADAAKLLPKIYALSELERQRLEARLRELRAALDRLSESGGPQARTAGA